MMTKHWVWIEYITRIFIRLHFAFVYPVRIVTLEKDTGDRQRALCKISDNSANAVNMDNKKGAARGFVAYYFTWQVPLGHKGIILVFLGGLELVVQGSVSYTIPHCSATSRV
jgi:hypothetical protein